MPDDIIEEILQESIKQAQEMNMEALRRFGEDFDIDMRAEMDKVSAPLDHLDPIDPAIVDPLVDPLTPELPEAPEPSEEGEANDQDGV